LRLGLKSRGAQSSSILGGVAIGLASGFIKVPKERKGVVGVGGISKQKRSGKGSKKEKVGVP